MFLGNMFNKGLKKGKTARMQPNNSGTTCYRLSPMTGNFG
jgi:hypothetical protein